MAPADRSQQGTPQGDGDAAAAFGRAYRELAPAIRRFVRRQVPADAVEDVVSETFVVIWRRWAEVPAELGDLRPWVFGVARHKIAHVREQQARSMASAGRLAAQEAVRRPDRDVAEDYAALDQARRLLAVLPPAEYEAMALTVWAGLSPAEAAEVLGCSVTALTTRVSRARRRLQDATGNDTTVRQGEA